MSKLYITNKYYSSLTNQKSSEVIRLYGYNNRDEYLTAVIEFLNKQYPFLKIKTFELMSNEEAKVYSMYNGFVKGDFKEYDEVTVSFSETYTKAGNTIIAQQVMPMLRTKIMADAGFLVNKRIKKIFLLTSHKSTTMDMSKNSIDIDTRSSSLQLAVKCLVTLGFDVHQFIPIINLDSKSCFSSVKELVDTVNYVQFQNQHNIQHKNIELRGNKVIASFSEPPKGQDSKYFGLRYLTAIMLNDNNIYDISQAYNISSGNEIMEMLLLFSNYIQNKKIIVVKQKEMPEKEYKKLIMKEEDFLKKIIELSNKYGEDGNTIISSVVRLPELQKELRKRLINRHGCKCLLCDVTNEKLLIASHIKQASECNIHAKGDTENAFLLCANHDKLFDKYLISFNADTGKIMISDKLTEKEIQLCNLDKDYTLPNELMSKQRIEYLKWHNLKFNQ